MAGSWKHVVNDDGTPRTDPEDDSAPNYGAGTLLENMGDVQETLEECYGMVWYLARQLDDLLPGAAGDFRGRALRIIAEAEQGYQDGVRMGRATR